MRLIVNCKSGKQSQLFAIFLAIWFVTTLSLTKQFIVALLQSPVWLNLKIFIEELVVFNQIVNINIFMQYQLLKTFRISYCVMSRILDIYKFWNYSISTIMLEVVRLDPPSHNSMPYFDPSTTLYSSSGSRETPWFRFQLSIFGELLSNRVTVQQYGYAIFGRLARVDKVIFAWNEMRNENDTWKMWRNREWVWLISCLLLLFLNFFST